jgi:predicted RNase H-like HicB family nuclease
MKKRQLGKNMELKVILEPSDEGGFTVYAPSLPGCISEGKTKELALKNIKEAIELYLEPVEDDLILHAGSTIEKVAM